MATQTDTLNPEIGDRFLGYWLTRTGVTKNEMRIVAFCFVLALCARYISLLFGYSIADWWYVQMDLKDAPSDFLRDGRPLSTAVLRFFVRIGCEPPHAGVIGWIVLTLALIGAGLLFSRLWRIDRCPAVSCAATALIVLHPYLTEIYSFRVLTLPFGLGLVLAIAGLYYGDRLDLRWWGAALLITGSLLFYQTTLNYLFLALLLCLPFYLLASDTERKDLFRSLWRRLLAVVTGTILYVPVSRLISLLFHVPVTSRAKFLPFSEAGSRMPLLFGLLKKMFLQDEPSIPGLTKVFLLTIAVLALVALLLRSPVREGLSRALATAGVFVLALPASIGIFLILNDWWPAPRVFGHVGILWAGLVSLCLISARKSVRVLGWTLTSVVVISFVGMDNHILADQLRVNERDFAKANRIVARLELLPNFARLRGLAVDGGLPQYEMVRTNDYMDLNVSAFVKPWLPVPILNEASGYNFDSAPDNVTKVAHEYCKTVSSWPSIESVTEIDMYGVVCLER